jgi:hypothetical protein
MHSESERYYVPFVTMGSGKVWCECTTGPALRNHCVYRLSTKHLPYASTDCLADWGRTGFTVLSIAPIVKMDTAGVILL